MTLSRLIVSALLLSSRIMQAQKSGPQTEIVSIAPQLASVRQQLLSIEQQRQSIAKHEASMRRESNPTAFQPIRTEVVQYPNCEALAARQTDKLIANAARTQSVSADLLRAVIRQESAFRPCAVSDKGAQGLMQLMPATSAAFNVSDPFDPQQNISGGAAYLRQLMERYAGDASLALSAYNAGPQRVDREEGIPDIPETQNYVSSIFRDLGWTLPVRPSVVASAGLDQIEIETDVGIDTFEQDVPATEAGSEQSVPNPIPSNVIKDSPSMPPAPLP